MENNPKEDIYAKCRRCLEWQENLGIYNPDHCQKCETGISLHQKEVQEGKSWGQIYRPE